MSKNSIEPPPSLLFEISDGNGSVIRAYHQLGIFTLTMQHLDGEEVSFTLDNTNKALLTQYLQEIHFQIFLAEG